MRAAGAAVRVLFGGAFAGIFGALAGPTQAAAGPVASAASAALQSAAQAASAVGPTMPESLASLLRELQQAHVAQELGLLGFCLAVAYAIVWSLHRVVDQQHPVLFGSRLYNGVLFPAVALMAAVTLRTVLKGHGFGMGAVLRLLIPLLTALLVIRTAVLVLRAAYPKSGLVRFVERTVSWLAWGVAVLWITGFLPTLLAVLDDFSWHLGGAQVTLRSLLEGLLSAVAVMVGALWLSSTIERRLTDGFMDGGDQASLRKIAANLTRVILLAVGVLTALSAAGIPLGALGVVGGAIGVGIGFGLQKLAANYVSGFVILAERSLRIGDLVRVDGFEGRITNIRTRYTVVRALNGRESIVPNELLLTQRVENASLADRRVLMTTTVAVAYDTDLEALAPLLIERVGKVERVLPEPPPRVQLTAFGADGLQLTIPFWIVDPENGQNNVLDAVNRTVLATLRERGVDIPFPQRVVRHIGGGPVVEPATGLAAGADCAGAAPPSGASPAGSEAPAPSSTPTEPGALQPAPGRGPGAETPPRR